MTDLRHARILLSNDDGVNAPGLGALETIVRDLCDDVWVCAPETEQSATSHSLTIHRPLRLRRIDERRFAVDGTPTDCVLLAVNHLLQDRRPDFVFSGINHGSNIGEDVTYSGTIAAAMEATLLGIRAIAFSQQLDDQPADWSVPLHWGAEVIRRATGIAWPRGVLLNVNFPRRPPERVTGIHAVRHGNRKIGDELMERVDPRGRTYFWIGTARGEAEVPPDTDVHEIGEGAITITPLNLDLTDYPTVAELRKVFP